jgi:hypothetical protein
VFSGWQSHDNRREANNPRVPQANERVSKCGQVAQVVERSPEKAGVGGSTPSLATIFSITYNESVAFPMPSLGAVL